MPIDLMTTEFSSCCLFSGLPKNETLLYQGILLPHFQKYKAVTHGTDHVILVANIIRRDEALMWEGAKDLLNRAVKDAAGRARGIYSFELLAFNALKELRSFNFNELAQVLVNSSLRLRPGEEIMIRYSSVYGILRKLVEEAWGKISLTASAEILADEPGSLYSLMGRALKKAGDITSPATILVNDMSAVPLFNPLCEGQQAALQKLKARIAKTPSKASRECWVEGVRILPEKHNMDWSQDADTCH